MKNTEWCDYLEALFRGRSTPALVRLYQDCPYIIAAGPLWIWALHRKRDFHRSGLRPGAILVDYSPLPEALINLAACAIGNLIYMPLSPAIPLEGDGDAAPSPPVPIYLARDCDKEPEILENVQLSLPPIAQLNSCALLLCSSGTKKRKVVGLSATAIIHQIETHYQALAPIHQGKRLLLLPHYHAFGLILDLLVGIRAQQSIFIPDSYRLNSTQLLDILRANPVTDLALVPRQLALLLLAIAENEATTILKDTQIHTGGAPVLCAMKQRAKQVCRALRIGYGLTECGPGVLLDGQPIGCEVHLRALATRPFPEIMVRTPSLGFPSEPISLTDDGFLATGDLGMYEQDGNIEVVGRVNEAIKASDATWTTSAIFEDQLKRRFKLEAASLSYSPEPILTILSKVRETEHLTNQIIEFVSKALGIQPVLRTLPLTGANLELLSRSKSKDLAGSLGSAFQETSCTPIKSPPN